MSDLSTSRMLQRHYIVEVELCVLVINTPKNLNNHFGVKAIEKRSSSIFGKMHNT